MKHLRYVFFIVVAALIFATAAVVSADEPSEAEQLPVKITGISGASTLTDGKYDTYENYKESVSITVSAEGKIDSLYVIFDKVPGEWTLSADGVFADCGKNGFLHEYVSVSDELGAFATLTLSFEDGVSISEIYAFADGDTPDWVQIWEAPCARADLMLCSTHSDDEQLFFAGVLPYFAGELGLNVQVVYFTSPYKYHERPHEQLNGLWEVGVRNYPVFGEFVDAYSETLKDAYKHQEDYGFSRDDMLRFQVEMLRRFRPLVVIGHDFNGEYSHGQHMINTDTLVEALTLASDPSVYTDTAEKYGVWDTPKTYIHLYEENPITMDWDSPLEAFGGKTAFEVTQDGFKHHKSQHWTWFYRWIYGKDDNVIEKATDIKKYSPCKYGLYRTTVGLDSGIGDMFENIVTYKVLEEQERLEEESRKTESESIRAEEESKRAESESLRAEEESKRESESLRAEEEAAREESLREESIRESESLRIEEENQHRDKVKRTGITVITVVFVVTIVIFTVILSLRTAADRKRKLKRKRKKPRI